MVALLPSLSSGSIDTSDASGYRLVMAKKEHKTISARLPEDVWRKLHELSAELTEREGRSVSANEVLVRLIRAGKSAKL